jgi:hypothetical protein
MPYYVKQKDLQNLEKVRDFIAPLVQTPEEREMHTSLCEYIATAKAGNSHKMEKKQEYRNTPEGRIKTAETNRKAVRKYREKLKNQ